MLDTFEKLRKIVVGVHLDEEARGARWFWSLVAVKRMVMIETITGTVTTVTLDCLMCPTEDVKNLISLLCMNVPISGRPQVAEHLIHLTQTQVDVIVRDYKVNLLKRKTKKKRRKKLHHILKILLQSLKFNEHSVTYRFQSASNSFCSPTILSFIAWNFVKY